MQNPSQRSKSQWTIQDLVHWATSYFKSHEIDSPRATAEILLAHALKCRRIDLYLRYDQPLVRNELAQFKQLIKRRLKREPVAYITGVKEFWALELRVTKDVLIPRPETECLVETALGLLPEDGISQLLELGTGSGAVILALASERPRIICLASDLSPRAVELARQNAKRLGLANKITFFCGRWLAPLDPSRCAFDLIVSNPPYIPAKVIGKLQPEIYAYEPLLALDGEEDGLESFRQLIRCAHLYLKPKGVLLLEIGHDQKEAIQKLAADCGHYEEVVFIRDYGGYDRVAQLRKKMLRRRI